MHRHLTLSTQKASIRVSKKPQAQLRSVPDASAAAGRTTPMRKRRHNQVQPRKTKPDAGVIVAYLPLELRRKIRMLSASTGITMSDIIAEGMTQFFDAGARLKQ